MSRPRNSQPPPPSDPARLQQWLQGLARRVDILEGAQGGDAAAVKRGEAKQLQAQEVRTSEAVAAPAASASFTVAEDAPASPRNGDRWLQPSTMVQKTWVVLDGGADWYAL